jgi:hypothetical protein
MERAHRDLDKNSFESKIRISGLSDESLGFLDISQGKDNAIKQQKSYFLVVSLRN